MIEAAARQPLGGLDPDVAAEAEFRDILAARLRVQGPDHLATLITRHEIARMMGAQGNHAAAETEHRDVLADLLRALGPDHPSTRKSPSGSTALCRRETGSDFRARRDLTAPCRRSGTADHPVLHASAVGRRGSRCRADRRRCARLALAARLRRVTAKLDIRTGLERSRNCHPEKA